MDWLTNARNIRDFMKEITTYSLYGLGSIDSLLNLKVYELYMLSQTLKDDEIKDTFRKIKFHNFD